MSMKEMIARQYDYGCWARAKLLRGAEQLSDEQYFVDPEFGNLDSLHTLLVHMMGSEWLWRMLAQTGTLTGPPPNEETLATLADVEAGWQEEEAAFRAYLDELSDEDLGATVDTVSPTGQPYTFVCWEMLQHMLLHGMQHRTEAAAVLTSHGESPGDMDYLFFIIGRE